jgi:hypothetical protein
MVARHGNVTTEPGLRADSSAPLSLTCTFAVARDLVSRRCHIGGANLSVDSGRPWSTASDNRRTVGRVVRASHRLARLVGSRRSKPAAHDRCHPVPRLESRQPRHLWWSTMHRSILRACRGAYRSVGAADLRIGFQSTPPRNYPGTVIASVEDLVRCGLSDRRVRTLLDGADWYLVGSRAAGFGDGFSDWDTVLLTPTDVADEDTLAAASDEIFGIARPDPHGAPTLALHSLWRQAHGVDIKVLGPRARRRREAAARVEWVFDLRHAVPLHLSGTDGESYRERVGAAFGQLSGVLAVEAYRAFRQSRNEAVATLPRADRAIQAVAAAACVIHAAHFWLLAASHRQTAACGTWPTRRPGSPCNDEGCRGPAQVRRRTI